METGVLDPSVKEMKMETFRCGRWSDILLKTPTGSFKAHKVILASHSLEFMRQFLVSPLDSVSEIELPYAMEYLKPVIECMYTSELAVESQQLAVTYLNIAFKLEIGLVIQRIKNYFQSCDMKSGAITSESSLQLWRLCKLHSESESGMLAIALDCIVKTYGESSGIDKPTLLLELEPKELQELLIDLSAERLNYQTLYLMLTRWTLHSFNDREPFQTGIWLKVREAIVPEQSQQAVDAVDISSPVVESPEREISDTETEPYLKVTPRSPRSASKLIFGCFSLQTPVTETDFELPTEIKTSAIFSTTSVDVNRSRRQSVSPDITQVPSSVKSVNEIYFEDIRKWMMKVGKETSTSSNN